MTGAERMLALSPYLAAVLYAVVSRVASSDEVLNKLDTRAAIGWVGAIWLAPILGTLLYVWLGINRIEWRARELRTKRPLTGAYTGLCACSADVLDRTLAPRGVHLEPLVIRLVGDVTRSPLIAGVCITPPVHGGASLPERGHVAMKPSGQAALGAG